MCLNLSRRRLYQSVFILNLLYFLCGTTFAWSSPVLLKLQLTETEGGTVASMLSLGAVLGPFVSGFVLDRLGRKGSVALSMGLMSASWLILTIATNVVQLSIGRFIGGIAVGIVFSAIPIYIAEISEDSLRGSLNTLNQISCCSGSLLVYSVGPFVSYAVLHYIMLSICGGFFMLFPFLPKSPYFLIMKNDIQHARDTLTWLRVNRSASFVDRELLDMKNLVRQDRLDKGSITELFTSEGTRHALLLCVVLLSLQQLSGITVIFFYSEKIFLMTGTKLSSSACSIVIGVIMTASGFISPIAVKYFGYKKPLLVSSCGMALGMGGLGVFFLLKSNGVDVDSIGLLSLLSVVVYILFYNSGFSNIPWAISGEIFPSNVKPLALTLIAACCGLSAFLSSKFFPDLIFYLGMDLLFISYSCISCLAAVLILLFVQDTSGLSFADIQKMMNDRKRNVPLLDKTNVTQS